MGFTIKKNTAVAVVEETTEGTYVAPTSANQFVQVLADGLEVSPSKEVIERNIMVPSVGRTSPRTGQFQSTGAIPTEMRANSVQGNPPETDKLLKSVLGQRRQVLSDVTSSNDTHTNSIIYIEDLDIGKFEIGDIVMVKEAGAYHVSPITAIDDTLGSANITLLVPKPTGVFSPQVVIAKTTVYTVADAAHPSLSISKWLDGKVLEKIIGGKVASLAIENFTTGQIPTMAFGLEGLNYDRTLTNIPVTPAYDSSLPPIMLDGRVYIDGTSICINELTLSVENTLGFITCINASNGRESSRVTDRVISGTFNPYKPDDSVANYTKYKNNTPFSLFAYGKVPTSTPGEFGQVVAIYMPNCLITELAETDQDGILQDSITFSADRGVAGTIPEIYIAFI